MFPSTWPRSLRDRAINQCVICVEIGHKESDILHCIKENGGPFNTAGDLLDKLFDLEDRNSHKDDNDGNVIVVHDNDDASKDDVSAKNSSFVELHDNAPKSAAADDVSAKNSSFSKLEMETLTLIQATKCRLCRQKPRTVVLLPCSELMLCTDCSETAKTCPQCKETIELTINTFMC